MRPSCAPATRSRWLADVKLHPRPHSKSQMHHCHRRAGQDVSMRLFWSRPSLFRVFAPSGRRPALCFAWKGARARLSLGGYIRRLTFRNCSIFSWNSAPFTHFQNDANQPWPQSRWLAGIMRSQCHTHTHPGRPVNKVHKSIPRPHCADSILLSNFQH